MKRFLLFLVLFLAPFSAFAQSNCPTIPSSGLTVWSIQQWNACLSSLAPSANGTLSNPTVTGGTLSGTTITNGSASGTDLSGATVTVPSGVAQTASAHNSEVIDIQTLGAVPDGVWVVPNPSDTSDPLYGATMAASSCTLTTTNGNFTASMVGKDIDVVGAGTAGGLLATTVATYVSANEITTTACASTAVPVYRIGNIATSTGTVTASYAPGDTVTFGSGTFTTAGVGTILTTTPISASVNAAGSGGTANATCTMTGTLSGGTPINGVATFTLGVTLNSSGGISTINSLTKAAQYSANPTLTAVSVSNSSGCGSITGATVNVLMTPGLTTVTTVGAYSVFPSNPVTPSATSGSGAGATFTVHDNANGEYLIGTDNTAAINTAVSLANADAAAGHPECIYAPPGVYAIFGSSLTQFAQYVPGCVRGNGGSHQTAFVANPSFSGPLFSTDDAWALNVAPVNGPSKAAQNGNGVAPYGPTFENFTVYCDRSDTNEVDGVDLYDHSDKFRIEGIVVYGCPGRAVSIGALLKNDASAYAREGYVGHVRFENDGATNDPVEEISASTSGGNEITIGPTDCYAPIGTNCLLIHGNLSTIKGEGVIRAEGLEDDPNNTQFDLVQIGDTTNSSGTVTVAQNLHFVLLNPYFDAYGLGIYAASAAAQEYGMDIELQCTGGDEYGGCLNIQAGRMDKYESSDLSSLGYNLTVGAPGALGSDNILSGPAFNTTLSSNINSSAINDLLAPAMLVGGPRGGIQHSVTTVATLGTTCTFSQQGQSYIVTDATSPTFGATVAGSGSSVTAVMCNGSHWTVY